MPLSGIVIVAAVVDACYYCGGVVVRLSHETPTLDVLIPK
jgi:hypothetical protein